VPTTNVTAHSDSHSVNPHVHAHSFPNRLPANGLADICNLDVGAYDCPENVTAYHDPDLIDPGVGATVPATQQPTLSPTSSIPTYTPTTVPNTS
jgi:hypothetical protein